jgi:hypothetical protein
MHDIAVLAAILAYPGLLNTVRPECTNPSSRVLATSLAPKQTLRSSILAIRSLRVPSQVPTILDAHQLHDRLRTARSADWRPEVEVVPAQVESPMDESPQPWPPPRL